MMAKRTILTDNMTLIRPPQILVSVRDTDGRNNALAVGFAANVSHDPYMVMVGIEPQRFSYHMVKENPCFVVNIPLKSYRKEFGFLGSCSGRDMDKFAEMNIRWQDGDKVNAPVLLDCPINIECTVVDSIKPGTNELFIGRAEAIHVDDEYLSSTGQILWNKLYQEMI